MEISSVECFLYGMCVMFYSMMVWMFWRKGKEALPRLIMWIMLIQNFECFKDLVFFYFDEQLQLGWHLMTAVDMIIIPFYVFVLMELCKPGWFSIRKIVLHEIPFVLFPVLFFCTGSSIWYDCLIAWGAIYGTVTLVLTFIFISQYHRQLKERFSYQENINLNWLRGILVTFWGILLVWTISSFTTDNLTDELYLVCSLGMWMIVCYFVYKHESVIDELNDTEVEETSRRIETDLKDYQLQPELSEMVRKLFEEEKLYLNPRLKLSDVARKVGTNRTYLSRFFNQENGQTFYDYVNQLRVKYAEKLLAKTSEPVILIAEQSGFNSLSTFRRVFYNYHRCSPVEFRNQNNAPNDVSSLCDKK